jgi:hypothetical protein
MTNRGEIMNPRGASRTAIPILFFILAFSLVGCSWDKFSDSEIKSWSYKLFSWDSTLDQNNERGMKLGTYPVDLLFTDFYQALGGESILGPAISIATTSEGVTRQYAEAGLMVYDPLAPRSSRFALAPLGIGLGITQGELLGKDYQSGRIINGHLIIADFLAEYERLGGARFVGRPISEAYYNEEKNRIEQYFENLGFYKHSMSTEIHLMPYGAYACDRNCRELKQSAGIPALQTVLPDPFIKKALELGLPFVGKPLTGVHLATDGKQEVIFENLVLVADLESPQEVRMRPIAERLGNHAEKPSQSEESPLNVFYEIEAGLGFEVPIYFVEYLEQFGGMRVAGSPISEVFSPAQGIYWQCFTNLCLQFNLKAEGEQRLRPVPLGAKYKAEDYEAITDYDSCQNLDGLNIKVWEKETYVSSKEYQEIHVALYENNKPLKNYEPILVVTMPDGSQRRAYFQPSDSNGRTSIRLAPIEAPNGTLIAYKICLFGLEEESQCVGDNYLIWTTD